MRHYSIDWDIESQYPRHQYSPSCAAESGFRWLSVVKISDKTESKRVIVVPARMRPRYHIWPSKEAQIFVVEEFDPGVVANVGPSSHFYVIVLDGAPRKCAPIRRCTVVDDNFIWIQHFPY